MGIAVVFAGQGAQAPGMGRALYEGSRAARRVLDMAEKMRPGTLSQCFDGPQAALNETINTQPCLFAVDYACAVAAKERGVRFSAAAGFSLGEVAAVAFCGMLSFEVAFELVIKRAFLMQKCATRHPGGMAAVLRLAAEDVIALAATCENVYPVNFNCPTQTVVAYAAGALQAFSEKVKAQRGRLVPLAVSGAFHSPFMEEAAQGLRAHLGEGALGEACVPVYANRTARPYGQAREETLAMQVCSPVLWTQTIRNMWADGVDTFVEVGPGAVLSGLIAKTVPEATTYAVSDMASLDKMIGGIGG
ncbi:MAG: ACP S-malonyltransferase [Clostridia bacterium]